MHAYSSEIQDCQRCVCSSSFRVIFSGNQSFRCPTVEEMCSLQSSWWVVRDFCDELPAHTHLSSTLHSLCGKAGRVADRVSLDERVDKDKTKKVRRLDRARIEGSRADRSQIDQCRLSALSSLGGVRIRVPRATHLGTGLLIKPREYRRCCECSTFGDSEPWDVPPSNNAGDFSLSRALSPFSLFPNDRDLPALDLTDKPKSLLFL